MTSMRNSTPELLSAPSPARPIENEPFVSGHQHAIEYSYQHKSRFGREDDCISRYIGSRIGVDRHWVRNRCIADSRNTVDYPGILRSKIIIPVILPHKHLPTSARTTVPDMIVSTR